MIDDKNTDFTALCADLRREIIARVSENGGHLASSLGAVELTAALHSVYDFETDRVVFDVGHQSLAHKLLTGRGERFHTLRKFGGISGFPKPAESVTDAHIAGHASVSISVALGYARAAAMLGKTYKSAAFIGDGSLTGGLAYEALADAGASGLPLVVILNDNGMAISKNMGGMAKHLARQRSKPSYFKLKQMYHKLFRRFPRVDNMLRGAKTAVKSAMFPSSVFESMGFRYLGPIDGHDVKTVIRVLRYAINRDRPVLVHAITRKGCGYPPAERDPEGFHGVSGFEIGAPAPYSSVVKTYSDAFGEYLCELAERDERICAVTAAMQSGTGLNAFAGRFPERFFDTGITEGHAVSMCAGLARGGARPVCAIYSTFLQRSLDQIIHDVAISRLPVIFAVDRAGLVGEDGETHHGLFDLAFLGMIPGVTVYSPANFGELRMAFDLALENGGVTAIRYPRGGRQYAGGKASGVIRDGEKLTVVTYGHMVKNVCEAVDTIGGVRVIKAFKTAPFELDRALLTEKVLVVEDVAHGCGIRVDGAEYSDCGSDFTGHGSVADLERHLGLDVAGIACKIRSMI